MKINKKSWHYRLHDHYNTDTVFRLDRGHKVSLCWYFWATVGCLFKLLGQGVGYLFVVVLGLFVFWLTIGLPIFTLVQLHSGWIISSPDTLLIGIVMLYLTLVITTFIGCMCVKDRHMKVFPKWLPIPVLWGKLFKTSKPVVKSEPSLVVEFIKAKKAKVCPLVELDK